VLPNEQLVNLEREKRLKVDVLATYILHPGTALYIGYGDPYENLLPLFSSVYDCGARHARAVTERSDFHRLRLLLGI